MAGNVTGALNHFRDQNYYFRSGVVNDRPGIGRRRLGRYRWTPSSPEPEGAGDLFKNVGDLGMCGDGNDWPGADAGAFGQAIGRGEQRSRTPSGIVTTTLHGSGQSDGLRRAPSYRSAERICSTCRASASSLGMWLGWKLVFPGFSIQVVAGIGKCCRAYLLRAGASVCPSR